LPRGRTRFTVRSTRRKRIGAIPVGPPAPSRRIRESFDGAERFRQGGHMALTEIGPRIPTTTGVNTLAHDAAGNKVVVAASDEAIQDHGWAAILDAASRKYAAGEIEPDSNPPRVSVRTVDCK